MPNNSPKVTAPLRPVVMQAGNNIDIDLDDVFTDQDGDTLTYSVSELIKPSHTIHSLVGNILSISPSNQPDFDAGNYLFEITADDGNGGTATTRLYVSVEPNDFSINFVVLGIGLEFIQENGIDKPMLFFISEERQDCYLLTGYIDMSINAFNLFDIILPLIKISGKNRVISKDYFENSPNILVLS